MLEAWKEDADDIEVEHDRVTWRGVSLTALQGLVGASATALVTLEALGALVMALDRGFTLNMEPLEPLGAWEDATAAVLERVSIVDM